MNNPDFMFFNFFSVGSFIAVVFNFTVFMFFMFIRKKTTATRHLMIIYISIAFQNLAYFIATSFFHPLAAYHRLLTIMAVMPGTIHIAQFLFYFPSHRYTSIARKMLIFNYILYLFAFFVFFKASLSAEKIFIFSSHHWDFNLNLLSYRIALLIGFFILQMIIVGIFRLIVSPPSERYKILILLVGFMIITVLPGIMNALSRNGLIDRGLFQLSWNLVTVIGFFWTATAYINFMEERSTLIARVVGISLVTFLVMLQFLTWAYSRDVESAYDTVKREQLARSISDNSYTPDDMMYLYEFHLESDSIYALLCECDRGINVETLSAKMRNSVLFEKLSRTSSVAAAESILSEAPPYFRPYKSIIQKLPDTAGASSIRNAMLKANRKLSQQREHVARIPEENFRKDFSRFLDEKCRKKWPEMSQILHDEIDSSESSGDALRQEVLRFFTPIIPIGHRRYQLTDSDEHHHIGYNYYDHANEIIYEGGFNYREYRRYLTKSASRVILIIFIMVMFVIAGFPLFFFRSLLKPLRTLLAGVQQVDKGDLTVSVPIMVRDEIGYLSRWFNQMVHSMHTARKENEEIRHYLKRIIDSMQSTLISIDTRGFITHMNSSAETITGLSEKQAQQHPFNTIFPFMEPYVHHIDKAIKSQTPQKIEKIQHLQDGENRFYDIMIYPIIDDVLDGAVIRIDDITSRIKLEAVMVQSEKMMSVGGLAAGMAHEINNPLSGIMLGVKNIQRRISGDLEKNRTIAQEAGTTIEAVRNYFEKRDIQMVLTDIEELGARASRIVANMLTFSRKSESISVPTDLADLIRKTVELAANDYDLKKKYDFKDINLRMELDENIPYVDCITIEIQQVLLNLMKNAAQALFENCNDPSGPRITARLFRSDSMAVIEIEDNGPGMKEETEKRVFEPFFTTKEVGTGTGLGLSVSYFIITRNHDGEMSVQSNSGKGTKFCIKLPIREESDDKNTTDR